MPIVIIFSANKLLYLHSKQPFIKRDFQIKTEQFPSVNKLRTYLSIKTMISIMYVMLKNNYRSNSGTDDHFLTICVYNNS